MTHILVNPGYPQNHRSRTACANLLSVRKQQLAPHEFDRIRSESRLAWLADWEDPGKPYVKEVGEFTTTYSVHHNHRRPSKPTTSRPTSLTRRNNPHPTKVFLHLHLLKDKGYPSARVKPGQNPYADKYAYRDRSAPVPQGTMYYTLKDIRRLERTGQTETLKKIMNSHPEQPNDTWLNTPTRCGVSRNLFVPDVRMMHNVYRSKNEQRTIAEVLCYFALINTKAIDNSFKPKVVPSLHRWLKQAGKEEKEATKKLLKSLALNSFKDMSKFGKLDPDRYVLRRYEPTPRVTIHRPYKADFVLHPELTTT